MASGFVVRKNQYYDSVFLMRIAKTLGDEPGVQQCAVVMATDANKQLLADISIRGRALDQAGPNDLVMAVLSEEEAVVERLLSTIDQRLANVGGQTKPSSYPSLEAAATANPETNLAVISIPGEYAAREARKALEQGKHVFLFSNNVPLDQEVELKRLAQSRGLLVMGPDCGTSILNGVGIGFANVVRRGPVGVVGASGTGLQEFTSLVHQAGSGISHAIGTGSHDLSDVVGGITTLMAFDALEADPTTQVIAIVSKPAQPETLKKLVERIARCRKPVVGCFLGLEQPLDGGGPHFTQAFTIDAAVQLTLTQIGFVQAAQASRETDWQRLIEQEKSGWLPNQRYLRGLFAGGTFCYQSQQVLREAGIPIYSNSPLDKRYHLEKPGTSLEHSLIDMGDDFFTQGKPHPMIEATQRRQRILAEADDPELAILLLDFILGYIASPDPVGDLIEAIRMAKRAVAQRGGCLTVAASICGTDLDPQGFDRQKQMLKEAGVLIFDSNAQAARFCAELIKTMPGGSYAA
jgi:succinyl-CoA synthetase alpha subunit